MRPLLFGLVLVLAGCDELSGASEFTDAYFIPADTGSSPRDTKTPAGNSLTGDYFDELIPETRGAFRIDRRSAPTKPWIVFVGNSASATVTCESFAMSDWHKRVPAGSIIHVIELGANAGGDYPVEKTSPPAIDAAAVARTQQTADDYRPEYAKKGSVHIARWDATSASGALDVEFEWYPPYEDEPDAGPVSQHVHGSFDVTSCPVDW